MKEDTASWALDYSQRTGYPADMDGIAAAGVHTVLADADSSAYQSLRQRPVTRAERYALGKSLRKRVPRKSLADWTPPSDRPDPSASSRMSHQGRVDRLIPIRVGRMVASPYGFLRGTAVVMAEDVARLPQRESRRWCAVTRTSATSGSTRRPSGTW